MRHIELPEPPTPPFAISDGIGPICIHDARGVVVVDDLASSEEAARELHALNAYKPA
jgi:hypothetical protein